MDLARRAHQSPGHLVDEDGLRGLPLAQRTGQGQSGVVAFLVWELVRLQEPLNRRRREDGLNSTHIFPVKSATACTEVTVTGKMSIGPPKDRCGRLLETLPFARERPPFCLRKRNQSRDTTSFSHIYEQKTYTTAEGNICKPVQLTPVGGPTARKGEYITVTSLSQCAVKYRNSVHFRVVWIRRYTTDDEPSYS